MDQQHVDVGFPLTGKSLPLDHGYPLFGAVSRLLPQLHENRAWGLHPVLGARTGDQLMLERRSWVKLRTPAACIADLLVLAGKQLDVEGHSVVLGVPRVYPLTPSASLVARMVTVAGVLDGKAPRDDEQRQRDALRDSVRRKLAHLPLGQDPERVEIGVGRRHVVRIGQKRQRKRGGVEVVDRDIVVGFQVALEGLEATASLVVQAAGVGGRRHLGCGIFCPAPRVRA